MAISEQKIDHHRPAMGVSMSTRARRPGFGRIARGSDDAKQDGSGLVFAAAFVTDGSRSCGGSVAGWAGAHRRSLCRRRFSTDVFARVVAAQAPDPPRQTGRHRERRPAPPATMAHPWSARSPARRLHPADGDAGSRGDESVHVSSKMPFDTATAFTPVVYVAYLPQRARRQSQGQGDHDQGIRRRDEGDRRTAPISAAPAWARPAISAGRLFAAKTGMKGTHIPLPRLSAPMLQDLLAGNIHFTVDTVPGVMSFITSGTLRALAVTGSRSGESRHSRTSRTTYRGGHSRCRNVELARTAWRPPARRGTIVDRVNAEVNAAIKEPALGEADRRTRRGADRRHAGTLSRPFSRGEADKVEARDRRRRHQDRLSSLTQFAQVMVALGRQTA